MDLWTLSLVCVILWLFSSLEWLIMDFGKITVDKLQVLCFLFIQAGNYYIRLILIVEDWPPTSSEGNNSLWSDCSRISELYRSRDFIVTEIFMTHSLPFQVHQPVVYWHSMLIVVDQAHCSIITDYQSIMTTSPRASALRIISAKSRYLSPQWLNKTRVTRELHTTILQ